MSEEKKKMSLGKKILIGIGIYAVVGVIIVGIVCTLDDKKKAAEAEALNNLAEMDAIYASHDPQVFLGYALAAARKQDRITVQKVQPDVYSCIVEADISGYEYSMSDDGADADGMVAAACLFAFDCSEEIFGADEHIDNIVYYFRVKYKIDMWFEGAVTLIVDRDEFMKINYDASRTQIQNDYNEIKKIARIMPFGGDIEQRLKKYKK